MEPDTITQLPARSSMEEDDIYRAMVAIASKPRNPPPSYESSIIRSTSRKGKEPACSAEHIERFDVEEVAEVETEARLRNRNQDSEESEDQDVSEEEEEERALEEDREEIEHANTATEAETPVATNDRDMATNSDSETDSLSDSPPAYSCDIHIEGVFKRKMEMVDTTKRAQDRHWNTNFIRLHGTALNIYSCKREASSGRTKDVDSYYDEHRGQRGKKSKAPKPSPDNPPWLGPGVLEKKYNLSYADVGIAADYMKRRYVIRVRAETDQFLLSCFELSTLVAWLDALYAAIGVAAPIDQREFPRDHSIPRLQRLRWLRQHAVRTAATTSGDTVLPARLPSSTPAVAPAAVSSTNLTAIPDMPSEDAPEPIVIAPTPAPRRIPPPPPELSRTPTVEAEPEAPYEVVAPSRPPPTQTQSDTQIQSTSASSRPRLRNRLTFPFSRRSNSAADPSSTPNSTLANPTPPRHECLDNETGKWRPRHRWSQRHDHVYAKLCYGVLLFRSPRKSNYVVGRGGAAEWFVDWATGRMVRVSPPGYGEVDMQMTMGNSISR